MLELIHVGHSAKSRGVNGKFKARIEEPFKEDCLKARALFINLKGSKVPFLVESSQDQGHLIFKLEEIDSPEEVSSLLSKELYLDKKEVSEATLKDYSPEVHFLVGYHVYDQNEVFLGQLLDVIQYPDQLLGKILVKEKEILLPIHEDLILQLNEESQTLKLEIIEGLLEL